MQELLSEIRSCRICEVHIEPRPVISVHPESRILLVGQAPGTRVHATGVPWNDPSGDTLREWMGIDRDQFYNDVRIGIMPMGFCYPGKGRSGDLPPRPECAPTWHKPVLALMPNIELIVLIGQYAQGYYLGDKKKKTLTETVRAYRDFLPEFLPLPHPSPRNRLWMRKNQWFAEEVVPIFKKEVQNLLST